MGDRWAVRASRLYDGRRVREGVTVLVEDGVVLEVGPGILGEFPVLDLDDDVTLLPGLVDTHAHLCLDASTDVVAGMAVDDATLLARMTDAADRMLRAGITTVRDLGDRSFLATEVDTPMTVLAAGPPLTTPGGHCWFLGGEVDGRDAMLKAVQERADCGCSVVKVMVSGGNITPGSSPFVSQVGVDDLRAITREAHALGLQVAAHAHATASVVDALDAGVDTLEHATFMDPDGRAPDDELLRRVAGSGVVISSTPAGLPGSSPPPHVAKVLGTVARTQLRLLELGARMAVGSDCGVGPGKPHDVLPWTPVTMAEHGFAPADCLRAMTSTAAEAVGLGGRKGVIAPGADADLLAVQGDPTTDPTALQRVVGLWAGGQAVRR